MEQKLSGTVLISESLGIENTNNFNTKHFNMKQQNMTAVEWLFMTLSLTPMTEWYNVLEKAKAMEKEQIMMAYDYGEANEYRQNIYQCSDDDVSPEQYYNKTYNK
jgi:hypothetical protein